jgi:hypothetical protein
MPGCPGDGSPLLPLFSPHSIKGVHYRIDPILPPRTAWALPNAAILRAPENTPADGPPLSPGLRPISGKWLAVKAEGLTGARVRWGAINQTIFEFRHYG